MRPRVFVVQPVPDRPLDRLRDVADVDVFPHVDRRATRAEMAEGLRAADYLFALGENPVDGPLMDVNLGLRMIAAMEIFPVHLDLAAATARGIPVTGLPHSDEITETTAELTMALLCAVMWRIPQAQAFLRSGRWAQYQSVALPANRLRGKSLGIVGLGKIGRGLARRARAHAMDVNYTDRRRLPLAEEASLGVSWRGLEDLFAEADVVALCTTLTRETEDLVGADLLGRMRRGSVLINTSRGRVLDEVALADALEDGRLAAAGLDVYRREVPDPHPGPTDARLLAMDNVVLTPHIGTSAVETREWMAGQVVDRIIDHVQGRRPETLLNPEVYGEQAVPTDRIG